MHFFSLYLIFRQCITSMTTSVRSSSSQFSNSPHHCHHHFPNSIVWIWMRLVVVVMVAHYWSITLQQINNSALHSLTGHHSLSSFADHWRIRLFFWSVCVCLSVYYLFPADWPSNWHRVARCDFEWWCIQTVSDTLAWISTLWDRAQVSMHNSAFSGGGGIW